MLFCPKTYQTNLPLSLSKPPRKMQDSASMSSARQWDSFELFPMPPFDEFSADSSSSQKNVHAMAAQIFVLQKSCENMREEIRVLQSNQDKFMLHLENRKQESLSQVPGISNELQFLVEAEVAERVQLKTQFKSIAKQLRDLREEIHILKGQSPSSPSKYEECGNFANAGRSESRRTSIALSTISRHTNFRDPIPSLPGQIDEGMESLWSALVVALPRVPRYGAEQTQEQCGNSDLARNVQLRTFFSGESGYAFVLGIDGTFSKLFTNRPWMPLKFKKFGHKFDSPHCELVALANSEIDQKIWTKDFLTQNCITHDPTGNKIIYVTLQNAEISLEEMSQFETSSTFADHDRYNWFNVDERRIRRGRKLDAHDGRSGEDKSAKQICLPPFSKAAAVLGYSFQETMYCQTSQPEMSTKNSCKISNARDDYTKATPGDTPRVRSPSSLFFYPRFTRRFAAQQQSSDRSFLENWRVKSPTFFRNHGGKP